jgi:hypothetical protein
MMKEKQLYKYVLDYDRVWEFWESRMKDVNLLSSELLKCVDFKKGEFFTLLPSDAHIERIHKVSEGYILPQNPCVPCGEGSKWLYSETPTLHLELAMFLLKKLRDNKFCLFDDVSGTLERERGGELYQFCGLCHQKEIYYLITREQASLEVIKNCLRASNEIWHSLCVIAPHCVCPQGKELTPEDTQKICSNIEMAITLAYDGEGYLYWEKTDRN